MDYNGSLLVVDSFNHRVLRCAPGGAQGSIVGDGNGSGNGLHQLEVTMIMMMMVMMIMVMVMTMIMMMMIMTMVIMMRHLTDTGSSCHRQ